MILNNFNNEAIENREKLLDFLRGFSLFGILAVNLPMLAEPQYGISSFHSISSEIVRGLVSFFFTGKFFILFSFVFGYGFSILIQGLEKKNMEVKKLFYRRLLGLGFLGILHGIFFFEGDILFSYAILGFFLFSLKNQSEEKWKKYIISLWILSFFCYGLLGYLEYYLRIENNANLHEMHRVAVEGKLGSFWDGASQRVKDLGFAFIFIIVPYNWPSAFLMFLVGIYSAKRKILSEPKKIWDYAKGKKRYILLFAIISNLGYSYSHFNVNPFASFFLGSLLCISGVSLSFLYVLVIIRFFFLNPKEGLIIQMVSNAGTMSLSNYLLQSILAGFIFYGWGLGFFTQLSPEQVGLVTILIYLFNLIFSMIWKKFFSLGPFEWLLRKWMYYEV